MTDYRVDVYDTSGALKAVLTEFTSLAYTKQVNGVGLIEISLKGDHSLLQSLSDKWLFEIWRKPDQGDWAKDTSGLFRRLEWRYSDRPQARLYCYGLLSMLSWRIVAFKAGTTNRSLFTNTKAETIANTLVKYNATADATIINGRLLNGAITGLSAAKDNQGGNTLDWYCAYDNLNSTLQDLALVGGGDFDIVRTGTWTFEWRWYEGQLGTDRSASVIFALERGNLANPVFTENNYQHRNIAIVGGKGEEDLRAILVVTGSTWSAGNQFEVFVNATDVETEEGLIARGESKLAETAGTKNLVFDVLQTPSTRYGVHYFLGDLVSAINPYNQEVYKLKVDTVAIALEESGAETVSVGVRNV